MVTAALGALTVGGAAIAGAQSTGTVAKVTVQSGSDQGQAGEQADGPGDQQDGNE
jgi:hypothetical protein